LNGANHLEESKRNKYPILNNDSDIILMAGDVNSRIILPKGFEINHVDENFDLEYRLETNPEQVLNNKNEN
jgi:hypothetical protein